MDKPTIVETAYAAGLLDGEGTVHIRIQRERWHSLQVSITQTSRLPLEWLRARWGGSIVIVRQKYHTWTVVTQGAATFLRDVLPFLLVKRDKALLALELVALMHRRGSKRSLTDEELSIRHSYKEAIGGRG